MKPFLACSLAVSFLFGFTFVSESVAFAPHTSSVSNIIPDGPEGTKVFSSSEALLLKIKHRFPGVAADFCSHTGMLSCLQGKLVKPSSANAVDIAINFIEEQRDLFANAEFVVSHTLTENGNTHILFDQVLDGVKIFGKTLKVHINKNGSVSFVSSDLADFLTPSKSSFVLSNAQAVAKAMSNLKTSESTLRGDVSAEKAYLPLRSGSPAVWIIRIPASKPLGDWELHVNALTGEIVSRKNHLQFLDTGSATVYKTNPLICDPEVVKLVNMNDKDALEGPYCKAINDDVDNASEDDGEYHYSIDDTHFDEAMVFYHINKIHDYFKDVHDFNELDKPMKATVHYGEDYDNAYYSPWSGGFAFGDGNKLNDLAREASVIYHEYTHAVTGTIQSLVYSGESGAINEGYSDYFGCVLTNDSKIGEWAMNKLNKPYMRWLEDTVHYPEDIENEVHADGKIWGCVCWDLLKEIGEETASVLIHKSRYYLSYRSQFVDGLRGIIEADAQLYDGKYKEQIIRVFAGRGIVLEDNVDKSETSMKFRELFTAE